jgi:hypothetical protein
MRRAMFNPFDQMNTSSCICPHLNSEFSWFLKSSCASGWCWNKEQWHSDLVLWNIFWSGSSQSSGPRPICYCSCLCMEQFMARKAGQTPCYVFWTCTFDIDQWYLFFKLCMNIEIEQFVLLQFCWTTNMFVCTQSCYKRNAYFMYNMFFRVLRSFITYTVRAILGLFLSKTFYICYIFNMFNIV